MTTLCLCDWVETALDRERRLALSAQANVEVAATATAQTALLAPPRESVAATPSHPEHNP